MPRARKPVPRSLRQIRTARDNARARKLGYKSYYDWRAHGSGLVPPDRPRLSGEPLARARGHRSAADLAKTVRAGSVVLVLDYKRGKDGRFVWVDVQEVGADGSERVFRLKGAQLRTSRMRTLIAQVQARGGVFVFARYFDGLIEDE